MTVAPTTCQVGAAVAEVNLRRADCSSPNDASRMLEPGVPAVGGHDRVMPRECPQSRRGCPQERKLPM